MLCSYWIEPDTKNLWVKIPVIPAGGSIDIFVKAKTGNSPNGDDVFELFDDFKGTNLDLNKWQYLDLYTSGLNLYDVSMNSSVLSAACNYDTDAIVSKQVFSPPFIITTKTKLDLNTTNQQAGVVYCANAGVNYVARYLNYNNSADITKFIGTTATNNSVSYTPDTNWHEVTLKFDGSNHELFIDGISMLTFVDSELTDGYIGMWFGYDNGAYIHYDYIFVRKYADYEPTYTVTNIGDVYKITISNPNSTNLTDYQIKINQTDIGGITTLTSSIEISDARKVLFSKPDNTVWYFDFSTSTWKQVTTDKSLLTKDDFGFYGHTPPINIDKTSLENLTPTPKVLVYPDNQFSSVSSTTVTFNVISHDKLIVQTSPVLLYDYEKINSITINATGSNYIKFLISRDLQKWYTWDGTQWLLVKSGNLNYADQSDVDLVLNHGVTHNTINSLTWTEFQQLYNDVTTPDKIAFAFVLQDDMKVDTIVINCDPKAFWKDVTKDCEILQGYASIIVTVPSDGDYKINYQDGETTTPTPSVIDGGSASG